MVIYDAHVFFVGSSCVAAIYDQDARARRQALPRAKLRHRLGFHRGNCAVSVLGGRIRRRRRRAIKRRRAGKRRTKLSLNENFVFGSVQQ